MSNNRADKVVSMREAVTRYVCDGSSVAIEGFTGFICFAAGHEIIRQRRRDLTLVRMTPDLIYDQLIGMGCARKLVFSWAAIQVSARFIGCATRSWMAAAARNRRAQPRRDGDGLRGGRRESSLRRSPRLL